MTTREEFSKTGFSGGMEAKFQGQWFPVASVDFEEDLIAIIQPHSPDLQWKRCENIDGLIFTNYASPV